MTKRVLYSVGTSELVRGWEDIIEEYRRIELSVDDLRGVKLFAAFEASNEFCPKPLLLTRSEIKQLITALRKALKETRRGRKY